MMCRTGREVTNEAAGTHHLIGLKRMPADLESLRTEIENYLRDLGMPVFYGYQPVADNLSEIAWDTKRHPDFKEFVAAAREAGAKLIIFHHHALSLDQVDEALERLEDSELSREEKRNFETRLRQIEPYEGFTCRIEISFSIDSRMYVFELRTEWYETLNDIVAELEAVTDEEEQAEDGSFGGYFSNN